MTGILPATDFIQYVYKKSIYHAGSMVTRIGEYPVGISKKYHHVTWVILSAYNPGGRLKHDGYNKKMMKSLKTYLKKYEYVEGYGAFHNFSEPLLMVSGDPRKIIYLARKFRQNAVVIVKKDRISRLFFLT